MGDRANIFVIDSTPHAGEAHGIYLYTHWNGASWPEMLRETLTMGGARSRWDDAPYLTRMLASYLFSDLGLGSTGGGISTYICDNEHEIIVLDIPSKRVAFAAEGTERNWQRWYDSMSFDEYCDQVEAMYPEDRVNAKHDDTSYDVVDAEVVTSLELEA